MLLAILWKDPPGKELREHFQPTASKETYQQPCESVEVDAPQPDLLDETMVVAKMLTAVCETWGSTETVRD